MVRYIFITIIIIGFVSFFLPRSIKLQATKYPRIILLMPIEEINKFLTNFQLQKREYHQLQELAIRLSLENIQMREKIQKTQEAPMLDDLSIIPAKIIARDNETGVRFLTINKSVRDNLQVNMPALTAQGVVGNVIETSNNQSIIETALSPGLKISGLDQRSRVNGIVEYADLSNLRFKYAFSESDIQSSDTIITSGLGSIFPRGLIIGIVTKVQPDPTRFFQYIEVKPIVNFNALDEVFILSSKILPFDETPRSNRTNIQNLKIEVPTIPRIR